MKRILTIIAAFALSDVAFVEEKAGKPALAKTETLEGIVIEKRANVKSYEAWNSPSDPYYFLDIGDVTETYKDGDKTWQESRKRHVTLRPSPSVLTADLAGLKGKRIVLRGHHTEGEPYKPSDHAEQVPMEPVLKTKPDGEPEIVGSRPANRGAGFVVEAIVPCAAGTDAPPARSGPVLELTLSVPPPVVAGQPSRMILKIKNVSTTSVNLPWPKFIDQFVTSEIKGEDGPTQTAKHQGLSLGHGKYAGGDLKPGATSNVELSLTFPTKGNAEVRCILETSRKGCPWWRFWEGRVESNTVKVDISAAPGATIGDMEKLLAAIKQKLPEGWVISGVAPVDAPTGWQRVSGGQGGMIAFGNPAKTVHHPVIGDYHPSYSIALMPLDWSGRNALGGTFTGGVFRETPSSDLKRQAYPDRYRQTCGNRCVFESYLGHDGWDDPFTSLKPCLEAIEAKPSSPDVPKVTAQEAKQASGERQIAVALGGGVKLKMVLIPAGEFMMGSGESAEATAAFVNKTCGKDLLKADFFESEHPQHRVRITKPFYLGTYHVTRGQFRQFVADTEYKTDAEKSKHPGGWSGGPHKKVFDIHEKYSWRKAELDQNDEHPVVNVSWNDAEAFCAWLSKKEGKTYRLPTEAEWEYACRAGTTTRYWSGDDPETLAKTDNVADAALNEFLSTKWSIKGRDGYVGTSPVGSFRANAFELYDMHGNAFQWCADWFSEKDKGYAASPATDPTGPDSGDAHILRGGSWGGPTIARSAERGGGAPDYQDSRTGFRVARTQNFTPSIPQAAGPANEVILRPVPPVTSIQSATGHLLTANRSAFGQRYGIAQTLEVVDVKEKDGRAYDGRLVIDMDCRLKKPGMYTFTFAFSAREGSAATQRVQLEVTKPRADGPDGIIAQQAGLSLSSTREPEVVRVHWPVVFSPEGPGGGWTLEGIRFTPATAQPEAKPRLAAPQAPAQQISQSQAITIACQAMGVPEPKEFLNIFPPSKGEPVWRIEYAHPLGPNWHVVVDAETGAVREKGRQPSR